MVFKSLSGSTVIFSIERGGAFWEMWCVKAVRSAGIWAKFRKSGLWTAELITTFIVVLTRVYFKRL
jgi:hypothetical protein